MAYNGVIEDIKKCISLKKPSRVPVFAISMEFDIYNLGIFHRDYEREFDKMVFASVQSVKNFDYDWVLLHPDDYIELEGIIKTDENKDKSIPVTAREYIIPSIENIKKFKLPDFKKDLRMPVYLDALKEIKRIMGDTICLTGRLAAPFSSAALVFGITNTMMLTIENTKILKRALSFFTELQVNWGIAQIKAGVDAIWVGDCLASSNFISAETYQNFAIPSLKILAEEIKKRGSIAYYHAAEKSITHLNLMPETGVDLVNIGEGADIKEVKKLIGKKICISGNLPPLKILANGTLEDVESSVKSIMLAGKENGGYIFNTEEGIPYSTPVENVRMMIKTAKKYCKYDN